MDLIHLSRGGKREADTQGLKRSKYPTHIREALFGIKVLKYLISEWFCPPGFSIKRAFD